ncbi:MAG: type I restriction-modification system subunit M [Algicola sp.]|nr:type I restriction-modification system subunit M [Algicola sp.]
MAIKKSELYTSLWESCDELRGGMDASQYKDYILPLLFIKYVSDKYAGKSDALVQIPEGASFDDLVKMKGKKDIGDYINKKVLQPIDEANGFFMFKNLADFDDEDKLGKGKAKVDRLSKLIGIFQNPGLDFSKNRAEDDDIMGDAYEYLMQNFAQQSGKSKGQFYTPAEVSRILASVIGVDETTSTSETVYDPTCGSGSLLLKVADAAPHGITIYGQEIDGSTVSLAKMNMVLHGRPEAVPDIKKGNTLANPEHEDEETGGLKTFDFCVANPPFSFKSWTNGFLPEEDEYERFTGFGIPPTKNGDYAFLLHILKSLKSTGKGAVILPHGVLFRGNAEADIRKNLIKRGYIKGIIGLPANLFFGTGIPACIIVLDKESASSRKGIFMIEASKGFSKEGAKNRLRERDIHKIVDAFTQQLKIDQYSRMVPYAEIEDNEYNLNLPRYINTQEEEDLQDINAHLNGGIPKRDVDGLQNFWDNFPSLSEQLFEPLRDGYLQLKIEGSKITDTIYQNPSFISFRQSVTNHFENWKGQVYNHLWNVNETTKPKSLIGIISEKLLAAYQELPLLDYYAVYQHLMDYWNQIMKDDVYLTIDGQWTPLLQHKKKKGKLGLSDYFCDLLPTDFVIAEYLSGEKEEVDGVLQYKETLEAQLTEMMEEHGGDEGLLLEVINDKGNITKADLKKRIKEIKDIPDFDDEYQVLVEYQHFNDLITETKTSLKEAEARLLKKMITQYKSLKTEEVKKLVVEHKWLRSIEQAIDGEVDKLGRNLSGRIKELARRYENTLPELEELVNSYEVKVKSHLEKMGMEW